MKHVEQALLLTLLVAIASGCSKSETAKPEMADAEPAATFAITGSPPAAPVSAAAAATATGAASPVATATAIAPGKAAAKTTSTAAAATAIATPPAPAGLKGAATHLDGNHFMLDVSSPGCRAGAPCAVTLRVAAVGDYHVNKEYPYKFTAAPAAGITYLGNGDANVFSRAAGDFHEDGEKAGTMTVRLQPSATGSANVSGTYKMSICSADQCQIEAQPVSLAVPVL